MKYFKKIVGERLYLSPINTEDNLLFCKWLNDNSTSDGLNKTKDIVTIENEMDYLTDVTKNGKYQFAIVDMETDTLIGTCGFNQIDHINQNSEVGIFIGEESKRSQGYGGETLNLLLDYGFNTLNLHNIRLGVYSFNERALACYKKAGFKEIGRIREVRYFNGKRYDLILLDILKDEFYN